jgi:hypothetical protein
MHSVLFIYIFFLYGEVEGIKMLRAQHSAVTAVFLRQRTVAAETVALQGATVVSLVASKRCVHMPGWKTKQSTKDVRTREQREVDRKARQIEKLPRPEALHDFQYPYEKTVLADHMFQPPVFETALDTPHLYHPTVPSDFFLYWNCSDFERTDYPTVPTDDHRSLIPTRADERVDELPTPASSSPSAKHKWINHRALLAKYLAKHQVSPHYFPHVSHEANLSVTFAGTYGGWRSRRDADTGSPLPPPAPVSALGKRNFWFTSHAGNYIELCELQEEPSIFFTTPPEDDGSLYTLVMASPDYPYRTSPMINDHSGHGGFFLHYMVANLKGGQDMARRVGDVVVPYAPPLPTEDGGSTRHMCVLFKQNRHVPNIKPLSGKVAETSFTFQDRCQFVLHADRSTAHASISSLKDVERSLPADPVAVTMFQTTWDIQVQEYYEKVGQPEPAFQLDEELEAILRFNSLKPEDLAVRARHEPDGSTNMGTNSLGEQMTHQLVQWERTDPSIGRMKRLWSRRTQLGANNRPITSWN